MAKSKEVDGNAALSQQLFEQEIVKIGTSVLRIAGSIDMLRDAGVQLKVIKLRVPAGRSGEWLAVVTADTVEGPVVAFHGADSLGAMLRGLARRLSYNSLKWKVDEYG